MQQHKNDQPTKPANAYMKYAGMATQLFVMLLLMLLLGQYLDRTLGFEKQYLTATLLLVSLVGYFYKIYIDLMR